MNIGIDIDGVILDFERMMRHKAEVYDFELGHKGKIRNTFNYLDNYDWSDTERKEFISKYLILGTLECNLVLGAKESIDKLKKDNRIIIISARGSINTKTIDVVLKVLKKYDIYYDDIVFKVTDKVKVCQEKKIDIMIDDNPDTIKSLVKNKINTIYFKDNDVILRKNKYLMTVTNWGEVLRILISK